MGSDGNGRGLLIVPGVEGATAANAAAPRLAGAIARRLPAGLVGLCVLAEARRRGVRPVCACLFALPPLAIRPGSVAEAHRPAFLFALPPLAIRPESVAEALCLGRSALPGWPAAPAGHPRGLCTRLPLSTGALRAAARRGLTPTRGPLFASRLWQQAGECGTTPPQQWPS